MKRLALLSMAAVLSPLRGIAAADGSKKDVILRLQREQAEPGIIDRVVEQEAEWHRRRFHEMPIHADRSDDDTQKELRPGTPVWFLLVLPRVWVTATVAEVLPNNEVLIELTQDRKRFYAERGKTVRAVREEDAVVFEAQGCRDRAVWEAEHNDSPAKRRTLLERGIRLDPGNPHFYDNMGIYWIDDHRKVDENSNQEANLWEGFRWYRKSIEIEPTWYHTYYNLAIGLLRTNENDDYLLRLFVETIERNPLYLDAIWRAADQNRKLGNHDEECYHWRVLLELNKNPSPNPIEDPWGPHNGVWEEWLPEQIGICMEHIARSSNKSGSDEL